MKRQIMLLSACTVALLNACSSNTRITSEVYAPAAKNELRAPATPLVTIDPYTSAWSFADRLNEESVRHWTGRNFPLLGSLRVDGVSYRFMGTDKVEVTPIIGTAASGLWEGAYTFGQPEGEWTAVTYEAKGWKTGKAAFGTDDTHIVPLPGKTETSGYAARSIGPKGQTRKTCSCNIHTMTTSSCTSTGNPLPKPVTDWITTC